MKTQKIKYTLLFWFLGLSLSAQSSFSDNYEKIKVANIGMQEKHQLMDALFQNTDSISQQVLAQIYYDYFRYNWSQGSKVNAKRYAIKEKELRKQLGQNDTLQRSFYNLGYIHSRLVYPQYNRALNYLDSLIMISDSITPRLGNAYREKADIYDKLGDFQRAIDNYYSSERILKKLDLKNRLLSTYINISGTIASLNDNSYLDDFLENDAKIEQLLMDYEISPESKIRLLLNQGSMFGTLESKTKAKAAYEEALVIANKLNDSSSIFGILNNLGVLYTKEQEFPKALTYLEQSRLYIGDDREFNGSLHDNLGDVYKERNEYQQALEQYSLAVNSLLNKNYTLHKSDLPTVKELSVSPYKKDLLIYLIDASNAWMKYYQDTNDQMFLENAYAGVQLVDQIIDMLYYESDEVLSKLFWRGKGNSLYTLAVSICHELKLPEKAFYYMEKNKGIILLDNILEARAKHGALLSEDLIEREQLFLRKINSLQLSLLAPDSLTKEDKDSTLGVIFNLKIGIESLRIRFQKMLPNMVD